MQFSSWIGWLSNKNMIWEASKPKRFLERPKQPKQSVQNAIRAANTYKQMFQICFSERFI